jgi:hypothetical protein
MIPTYLEHLYSSDPNPPLVGGLGRASPRSVLITPTHAAEFEVLVSGIPGAEWRELERVWEIRGPTPWQAAEILAVADLCDVHVSPVTLEKLRQLSGHQ